LKWLQRPGLALWVALGDDVLWVGVCVQEIADTLAGTEQK
jgi:hypothetical protein